MKRKHTEKKSARRGGIKSIIVTGRVLHSGRNPYVNPESKQRLTFTKELRNKNGYDNHLKQRYAH